jgi:uncharacterized protein (DUF1697 family)
MKTYVALLRGINLGSHNKIAMDHLRKLFVALGHHDVKTYIQSGNVIFKSPVDDKSRLAGDIEQRIAEELGVKVTVLVRTRDDLAEIVANSPFLSRESDPKKLHVAFLSDAPDPERLAGLAAPAGEPAEFSLVGREIYLYYPNGYGRTKLTNAYVEKRLGVAATTRNWRVVNKLYDLLSG